MDCKECTRCKIVKPLGQFRPKKLSNPSLRVAMCNSCRSDAARKYKTEKRKLGPLPRGRLREYHQICTYCGVDFILLTNQSPVSAKRKYCSQNCVSQAKADKAYLEFEARFYSSVNKEPGLGPQGDCWEWTGKIAEGGYGTTRFRGRNQRAHRAIYQYLTKEELGSKDFICHKCDNKKCVNPAHLFKGDAVSNMADFTSKGLNKKGEEVSTSKLTNKNVQEMRLLHALGSSYADLAKRYGVTTSCAMNAIKRITWKHIE